jgi:hypothetical protein
VRGFTGPVHRLVGSANDKHAEAPFQKIVWLLVISEMTSMQKASDDKHAEGLREPPRRDVEASLPRVAAVVIPRPC